MFWFVTTFIAVLAGIAFGLISFQTTSERIMIAFEIEKCRTVFAWFKESASQLREKGREYRENSRHS